MKSLPDREEMSPDNLNDAQAGLLPTNAWRILQLLLWLVGVGIVICLLFLPELGINLFWDLLIPVAPLVVVLVPGIWRNVCPLATTALAPRHFGKSAKRKLSAQTQGQLFLLAVIALWLIVPLRHLSLNFNGPYTAIMLLSAAAIAIVMGSLFEWRSGWCGSLCPIHPVERLYGSTPLVTVENAHCESCEKCVSLCPDSTKQMTVAITRNVVSERFAGTLMIGGFFGFLFGWNQVPDYHGVLGLNEVFIAYAWPFAGGLVSLLTYLLLRRGLNKDQLQWLNRYFATAAVACYYWYRIPALLGVGLYPGDGMLVDLSQTLPIWFPMASQFVSTVFLIWFMLLRPVKKQSWAIRPVYAS